MRKLKLESLKVESFDTTAVTPSTPGTVQAHGDSRESVCVCRVSKGNDCRTQDYQVCPDTEYLDCTLVCSLNASCPETC